jgi:hypothetical protein
VPLRRPFFLLNVYNGSKICPTVLETVGLRVPNRNFRDFKLFHVNLNRRNCPSARCTSAANAISRILVHAMVGLFWLMTCYQCKYWTRRCSSVTATSLNQLIYVLSGYWIFATVLLLYCFTTYLFCFFSVLSCVFVLFCILFVFLCWLCNWRLCC